MAFQDEAMKARSRLHLGRAQKPMVIGAAALILVVVACAGFGAVQALSTEGFTVSKSDEALAAEAEDTVAATGSEPAEICVYVSGAVAKPEVYFLAEGSRVADAIVAAGGFTDDAAVEALNLARVANDGEQINVPTQESQQAAAVSAASSGVAATLASTGSAAAGGLVNINSADAAALQTLDGVGEATAKKIIADREKNGPFKTIEDLKRVSGIGDKKFENLRDSICV